MVPPRLLFAAVALFLLATLVPVSAAAAKSLAPSTLRPWASCTTTRTRGVPVPARCPPAFICQIFSFGRPAVDVPSRGRCRRSRRSPSCSVSYCAARGPRAVCRVSSVTTSCYAWADRRDGGPRPICPTVCTEECRLPRLVASNGRQFCNFCKLASASCEARFRFFGPLNRRPPSPAPSSSALPKPSRAPLPLPLNAGCTTFTQFANRPPRPCAAGLQCVLSNFGMPAADVPTTGRCRRAISPPSCSVSFCARNGAQAICRVSGITATCRAWATRTDGGPRPQCTFACTRECQTPRLVASNGRQFCTFCVLSSFSCNADFAFFGPVKAPPPSPVVSAVPAKTLSAGEACTTFSQIADVPPVKCASGLVCLLSNFGFPAADRPSVGKCTRISTPIPTCSVPRCTRGGAKSACRVSGQVVTCSAWATRQDGGPKPMCDIFCTQECLTPRLIASNGKPFCNFCILSAASCRSNFRVSGPVSSTNPKPSSKPSPPRLPTTSPAPAGARCTTVGSLVGPKRCANKLTCVVEIFGNIAVDEPRSGRCRLVRQPVPKCTVGFCGMRGTAGICMVSKETATCGAWATRRDFGPKPNCNFLCTLECLEPQLMASNGKSFCNQCLLNGASCSANFKFFGPVAGGSD